MDNKDLWFSAVISGDIKTLRSILDDPKFDIDLTDNNKRTALHLACLHAQSGVVLFLINNGAVFNLEDKYHETPLMAAVKGDENSLDILLKYGSHPTTEAIKLTNSIGEHILIFALEENLYSTSRVDKILKSGVEIKDDLNIRALTKACATQNLAAIDQLVAHGADIDAMVEYFWPNTTIQMKHPIWLEIAMQGNSYLEVLDCLMQHSPDLSLTNAKGENLFEWAQKAYGEDKVFMDYIAKQMAAYENRLLNHAIHKTEEQKGMVF